DAGGDAAGGGGRVAGHRRRVVGGGERPAGRVGERDAVDRMGTRPNSGRGGGAYGVCRGGGERRGRAGVVAADARRDRRLAGVFCVREGAGGRDLVPFPTRRSSDLDAGGDAAGGGGRVAGHRRRVVGGGERPAGRVGERDA